MCVCVVLFSSSASFVLSVYSHPPSLHLSLSPSCFECVLVLLVFTSAFSLFFSSCVLVAFLVVQSLSLFSLLLLLLASLSSIVSVVVCYFTSAAAS